MKDQDPVPRIGKLLGQAYGKWQEQTYSALAQSGFSDIRPAHSPVFRFLDSNGSRVVELAERTGITKQSMAYLVNDLHNAGYVSIDVDPKDRRAKTIKLTPKGTIAANTIARLSRELEARLADNLGEGDLERLRSLLESTLKLT